MGVVRERQTDRAGQLDESAVTHLADGYSRSAATSERPWCPSPVVLHPVFCPGDHLHRSPEVARAAAAGRFRLGGRELALGSRPDWLGVFAHLGREAAFDLVQLYQGLDLGAAYIASGDTRFLETWEDLVDSFCEQIPVGHDPSPITARRIQNWLYAWQRFASRVPFPGLRPGLAPRLVGRIDADAEHLAADVTRSNGTRRVPELYTLLITDIALGRPDAASRNLKLLAAGEEADHRSDNSQDGCPGNDEHGILRLFIGAIVVARQARLPVPTVLLDRADQLATDIMHYGGHDSGAPRWGRHEGDRRALLDLAARVLYRPDLASAVAPGAPAAVANEAA